jgi:peptidoglycan/xylan/chitin deacetylase (PgdA/CDA1 family)
LTRRRLKVLCYHGFALADEVRFRPKLFISSSQFEQRLRAIQRYGLRVLKLDEAIDRLYSGTLPEHSIVITVDDGFHSFHRVALPFLLRFRYPAAVYVTTYYVQKGNPIFRLAVQYMFWKSLKQEVVLKGLSGAADEQVDLADPARKDQAMWAVIKHGEEQCTEEQRSAICTQLGRLLDTPYEEIVERKMFHLMTPDELRSLPCADVAVELHSHRHTFPSDDRARAEREITDNRNALKQWINSEASHFCYPSGEWHERQWEWLDSLKVKSSTTCDPGANSRDTPRQALRRFLDGSNIHSLEFEAALCGFSDLLRAGSRALR